MVKSALWLSIKESLLSEITAGHFPMGVKLPTEAALAQKFGVNRHTVRRALNDLKEDGIIRSRRGAGVFVLHKQTDYQIGKRVRFNQNLLESGRTPSRKLLSLGTRPGDTEEVRQLQLKRGALVHFYEGKSMADNLPIALFRSIFPANRFPDLPKRLQSNPSVTACFSDFGVDDYTRLSTRIAAVLASSTQASQLELQEHTPLLMTTSVNIDNQCKPIEFGTTWFAGDRVSLRLGKA